MASHQYQPASSPIREHDREGEDAGYYLNSEEAASSSCFCFQWWTGGSHRNAHRALLDGEDGRHPQKWSEVVKEKLMMVREVSEVAAGPRWKNFIRKVGGYFGKNRRTRRGQFGYDAESYALNFDAGFDGEDEGEDLLMYNARPSRFTGPSFATNNEQNRSLL